MCKADNLPPSCAVFTKYGSLNFLEPSGPAQACNGTALPLPLHICTYIAAYVFFSIRVVTDIRTQVPLNSLPISFKQSKYRLPISTAVNFCIFPPILIPAGCSFLLDPLSIFWPRIIFSTSSCPELPISVSSGSVNATSVAVAVSGTFP